MNPFGAVDITAQVAVPHSDGSFISERVSRIVELVREYDPTLDVCWIPPNRRAADEPAFAVVGTQGDGKKYTLFYIQSEKEFDGSVLQRIYEMDAAKHGNILSKIESENMAVKALRDSINREKREQAIEEMYYILRSKKHKYKHNGVVYE